MEGQGDNRNGKRGGNVEAKWSNSNGNSGWRMGGSGAAVMATVEGHYREVAGKWNNSNDNSWEGTC